MKAAKLIARIADVLTRKRALKALTHELSPTGLRSLLLPCNA